MLRHIWDGFLSILAAVVTVALCGVPSWYSYKAIDAGVAPVWVWAAIAGLAGVGAIMTLAFLRKAMSGVSPSRDRRRRA